MFVFSFFYRGVLSCRSFWEGLQKNLIKDKRSICLFLSFFGALGLRWIFGVAMDLWRPPDDGGNGAEALSASRSQGIE